MDSPRIDVKHAIQIAVDHMRSLGPLISLDGLRLEETTLNSQDNWMITLSVADPAFPLVQTRLYKDFEIDGQSGSVLSMRIRNPFREAS